MSDVLHFPSVVGMDLDRAKKIIKFHMGAYLPRTRISFKVIPVKFGQRLRAYTRDENEIVILYDAKNAGVYTTPRYIPNWRNNYEEESVVSYVTEDEDLEIR